MRSTFKVSHYLKKNEPKKNGEVTIMMRITINGRKAEFSSKLSVHPSCWINSKAVFKDPKIHPRAQIDRINTVLKRLEAKAMDTYDQIYFKKGIVLPTDIKSILLGENKKTSTVLTYCDKYLELNQKRVGKTLGSKTFSRYKLTRARVADFIEDYYNQKDYFLQDLKITFIEEFYNYLLDNFDMCHNTALKFLQRLRTMIFLAKNSEEIFPDPFFNYKFRFEKTDRAFLEIPELNTLIAHQFQTERLQRVKDMFIFSCYTGLSYIDLYNLTLDKIKPNLDGGYMIRVKRQKTGVESKIKLMNTPRLILEKYLGRNLDTLQNLKPNQCEIEERVMPVITNQKMNEYLAEIANICGIQKTVTFHVARHTFATLCLTLGTPIETVSKMMGHTSIETTMIYARIVDLKLNQDMEQLSMKLEEVGMAMYA